MRAVGLAIDRRSRGGVTAGRLLTGRTASPFVAVGPTAFAPPGWTLRVADAVQPPFPLFARNSSVRERFEAAKRSRMGAVGFLRVLVRPLRAKNDPAAARGA